MFVDGRKSYFIALKDHKPNFLNNTKVRILNPAKNELGKISKSILDRKSTRLQNLTKTNQWKDTRKCLKFAEEKVRFSDDEVFAI